MQYFVKNNKVHKYPVPDSCTVQYTGETLYDNPPSWSEKCNHCFNLPKQPMRLLIILCLVSLLSAEQEIRGVVLQGEEKYGPMVDSAIVVIKWGVWSDSTYSDSKGSYSIKSPTIGIHYIRAYKWIKGEKWESDWIKVQLPRDDWKWVPIRLLKEIRENSFELKRRNMMVLKNK